MKVSPSMLASDYTHMGACVEKVSTADWLHLDIMDGHFVPNISFGPGVVQALRPLTDLPFDVHLMISHPLLYLQAFQKAGAQYLTFHVECQDDPAETIRQIRALGMRPGLSLKPGTPVQALLPYLEQVDLVLVMTVEPGFGGQKFMPEMMDKIRYIKEKRPDVLVEVDGGINAETAAVCRAAGADVAVAGTAVFGAADVPAAIRAIRGE